MGYNLPGDNSNALRIYIEAQDRASAEVRKTLANIRKEEQAYQKDSEAIERQKWNATHTARERDQRDATEYYSRMRAKYDGDASMQRQIAEAEKARMDQIQTSYDESDEKSRKGRLKNMARNMLGSGIGIGTVMGAYGAAQEIKSAKEAQYYAKTGEDYAQAVIASKRAQEQTISFLPFLGGAFEKFYAGLDNHAAWEKLHANIQRANSDFKALEDTTLKATRESQLAIAGSLGAMAYDVQRIKDQYDATDRGKALERASEQVTATKKAYIDAKALGVEGAPLSDLRKKALQAQTYERELEGAQATSADAVRRIQQRMLVDESTAFRNSTKDAMLAQVAGPAGAAMRTREESDRRFETALKPYENLAEQRKMLDDKANKARADEEERWSAHIEAIRKSGDQKNLAEATAARARNLAEVDKGFEAEYARLRELEERKTQLIAQQTQERARLEQDAATARTRMIEDAMTPVTGAQIRAAAIRAFNNKQADARKGYDQLSQADKDALDETQRRQKESFYGGLSREDSDTADAIRRRQLALENEHSRSREDARKAELEGVDEWLTKERERVSYSASAVKLAEQYAELWKRSINERVDRERDLTIEQIKRRQLEAGSAGDMTLEAQKAKELRDLGERQAKEKADARKEDLAALEKMHQAERGEVTDRFARLKADANTSTAINAMRALGLTAGADLLSTRSQFENAKKAAADDPARVRLLDAQQSLAEARLRAAGDMPVTRETGSQSARFGGTLLRRMPGYDDPSMRMTQEVRDATVALRMSLDEFAGVIKGAETISIVKTNLR